MTDDDEEKTVARYDVWQRAKTVSPIALGIGGLTACAGLAVGVPEWAAWVSGGGAYLTAALVLDWSFGRLCR